MMPAELAVILCLVCALAGFAIGVACRGAIERDSKADDDDFFPPEG